MGGCHRADAHACTHRVVWVDDQPRVIRFRKVTSPRPTTDELNLLARLAKPRLAPVARRALAGLGMLAAAIVVVSHGRIVAPDLPAVVTVAQVPLRAFVGPVATLAPPVLTPSVRPRAHRVIPRVYPTPTTVPDVPVKKSKGKHAKGGVS